MKPIVMSMSLMIAGMILPAVGFSAERKNHQDEECSVATLFGDYLFTGRADSPAYAHTAGFPRAFAGVFTFDGEGKMSGVSSQSLGGVIRRVNVSATYTLDSDCTGTLTFASDGQLFQIFIARD